jgi:hypothetical protein
MQREERVISKYFCTISVDEMYSKVVIEALIVNAKTATVLGVIPAASDTVESGGRLTKQC